LPRLSVWLVRASLIYLLTGTVLGALLLAQKGIPYDARVWALFPMHMEFLLVGWLIQLAMGVAFWILPRFGSGNPRGESRLVLTAFILLNAGIGLAVLQPMLATALPGGRVLEAAALLMFVAASWRRVKPHGA